MAKLDRCPLCGDLLAAGEKERCTATVEGETLVVRCANNAGPARFTEAEAATKTEDGEDFPASSYAYTPDTSKPSGWKLRLEEKPGGGPTAKQVGMALAALSPGGFRGQKVQVPSDALPVVKRKIMAAWRKVHPDDTDIPAALKGTEALAGGRSFDEMRTLVQKALQDAPNTNHPWLQDIDDENVAYSDGYGGGETYQAPYDVDDDGNVTLGDPVKVEPRRTYVPVASSGSKPAGTIVGAAVEADGSFNDARARVQQAVIDMVAAADAAEDTKNGDDPDDDDDDFSVDVWIVDMGADWVVWQSYGTAGPGPGQWKMTYTTASDGAVTLTGAPQKVTQQTDFVPVKEARDRILGRVREAKGSDAIGGRIYGVQIIAYGDSKNGRRYPESVMRAAASKYEGAQAYDHHRTDTELETSTIQGLVGSYQNVTATKEGIQADLHLLPSATHAAEALDASLAAQSKGGVPLVGISHDVMANYRPVVEGGKRIMEATEIVSVNSSDLVANPAAGGKATRMVAGGTGATSTQGDTAMTLKELLAALRGATAEKRAELLLEHKAVIDEFGLDGDAVGRILDKPAAPAAEPAVDGVKEPVTVGATESKIGRSTLHGGMLIREAVVGVGLDNRYVETITKRLPESFTESELTAAVAGYRDMRVELEQEMQGREGGRVPHVTVTGDERDRKVRMLDNMLDQRYRGQEAYRSLKQAFVDITGANPYNQALDSEDFNRMILRESIGGANFDSGRRLTESAQSGTWNFILGDSITRRMVADYSQPSLQTWRPLVSSIVPIQDFRTQRIERLGGYGVLPIVNQGAPYQPLTTPGNEEATYAINKKGGTEDLTLETIANDDLRAVQRIPARLGLAAAQTLYRFVFDMFNTNITYTPDGTAVFAAGHNNTAATALSSTALEAARLGMRKQAAYGDTFDILSLTPKYLVAVSALEPLAWQLCTSAVAIPAGAPVGAAANQPNLHQGMTPILVDYWAGPSATNQTSTAWYVVADPDMCPTIEIGFYQGRQDPELFIQNDPTVGSVFTSDKLTYKIRHIYSGTPLDFRGLYRGNS